jgi:hypothetical protein
MRNAMVRRALTPILMTVAALLGTAVLTSGAAGAKTPGPQSKNSAHHAMANILGPTASAVVPDSGFGDFTPIQFPGNDDNSWTCPSDDTGAPAFCAGSEGETVPVPFGFNVNFYGTEYGGAYVNNNGNITFDGALSTYTPFGLSSTNSVIIAPFFADVDTRVGNTVEFGTGTFDGNNAFIVNWPSVGCFAENDAVTDNFQLILIDRPDLGSGALGDDFQIEFNYDTVQWDAGQASGGDANCTNSSDSDSAVAGFSNGTSTPGESFELPGSQSSGALLDSNEATGLVNNDLNSSVPGRYVFNVSGGQPQSPPMISVPSSATFVKANAGTLTISATGTPTPSFSETGALPAGVTLTDNGDGTATVSGTPSQTGSFPITVTATNGVSPDASGSLTLSVVPLEVTTTSPLPGATKKSPYSIGLEAEGGSTPYKWSLAKGSVLPAGLVLSKAGIISGKPTKVGTFTFDVKVKSAKTPSTPKYTASAVLSLVVSKNSPA